ncbi:MAG: hypothetical protein P4L75_06290 [Clostridia bacterium]|nr:hypothetical protein [Clostridia bacterium]MDR3644641.1 hypothetical protein [Clostridia bacterium]
MQGKRPAAALIFLISTLGALALVICSVIFHQMRVLLSLGFILAAVGQAIYGLMLWRDTRKVPATRFIAALVLLAVAAVNLSIF